MNKRKLYLLAIVLTLLGNLLVSLLGRIGVSVSFKDFVGTVPAVVGIIGIVYEKEKPHRRQHVQRSPFEFARTFKSGILGGLIGGFCSGIFILVAYYTGVFNPKLLVSLRILPYMSISGCVFGGLIQLAISLFNYFGLRQSWSSLFGSILGCLVAGTITGVLGMWLFGDSNEHFVGFNNIIIASAISAIALMAGCLLYDYQGKIVYFLYSVLTAIIVAFTVGASLYLILINDYVLRILTYKIESDDMKDLLEAGAILGSVNGFVFGFVIGLTIVMYRIFNFSAKQQKALV